MEHFSRSDFGEEDSYHEYLLRRPRFIDLRSKQAEFFNQLLDRHVQDEVIRWVCHEDIGWVFELEDLVLDIENPTASSVKVRATSETMPRIYIDPLRQELRRILSTALVSNYNVLEFAITLLQLLEEAVASTREWRNRANRDAADKGKGWNVNEVRDTSVIFDNPLGADLDTINEPDFHLLGKSVKEICAGFSDALRIIDVEPVFRSDLVSRFRTRQKGMLNQLRRLSYHELRECVAHEAIPYCSALDNPKDLASELCRPRVAFHGTSRHKVTSIVRWGFVIPGSTADNRRVLVQHGSSFGKGIYTSPDAEYALAYSRWSDRGLVKTRAEDLPGLRLIICAVLMGRAVQVTREATRRTTELADERANSHLSPNKCEYVVFDAAQIIPCYVVHLDFGVEAAREWLKQAPDDPSGYDKNKRLHPKLVKQDLFPAELEAVKQAKKAAALKWFPYGYGTAKGNSFVVEEIGEVSDDEENYGEYQGQRQEVKGDFRTWKKDIAQSGSWFDEYQKARRLETKVKNAQRTDD
jgi:hypothetical protein